MEQITRIERREARILTIRNKQLPQGVVVQEEEVATSPEARFHVGKSQNYPESIPLFLQRHVGDPAVKVSAAYLLCRLECNMVLIPSDRTFYPSSSTFSLLRPRKS